MIRTLISRRCKLVQSNNSSSLLLKDHKLRFYCNKRVVTKIEKSSQLKDISSQTGVTLKEPKTEEELLKQLVTYHASQYSTEELKELKKSKVKPYDNPYEEKMALVRVQETLFAPMYGETVKKHTRNYNLKTTNYDEYFKYTSLNQKNLNMFIRGLCERNLYIEAIDAFNRALKDGVKPNVKIYTSLLKGCVYIKNSKEAFYLLQDMLYKQIEPDVWVFNNIIEACIAEGDLNKAYETFDAMSKYNVKPNVTIFTSLIKGCIRIDKDIERAWKTYQHMKTWHCRPDQVIMSLMIHACSYEGMAEKALNIFKEMKEFNLRPTEVTYDSLIHVFSKRKDYYDEAFNILKEMRVDGFAPDLIHLTNILAVCAKGADIKTAELIFDEIVHFNDSKRKADEYVYSYMIEAYSNGLRNREFRNSNELVQKGEKVFDMMIESGIKPTILSLNAKLALYTRHSRINRAMEWKNKIKDEYKVEPDCFTYNALIEMYGRLRRMDNALDIYNLMKAENVTPNLTTYHFLIKGCTRNHYYNTGMKLIREMFDKGFFIDKKYSFIVNFRRLLTKWPDMVREIDGMTGKAYEYVLPWRRPGRRRNITYHRELTKEEKKRSSIYG